MLEDAVGRADALGRIVVIDDIGHLALAAQRRRVLDQQRVLALVVQPLAHELPPALLIDQARDGIGEVRELGRRVAGRREAHRLDPRRPAAPQPGQRRVDAARSASCARYRCCWRCPGRDRTTRRAGCRPCPGQCRHRSGGPVEEIGQTGGLVAERLEREHERLLRPVGPRARRVIAAILELAQVDLGHLRIGLRHPAQHRDGAEPERAADHERHRFMPETARPPATISVISAGSRSPPRNRLGR